MLKMTDVRKQLGKFSLGEINLELPKGYIMGLIGPNGAGKTTLLNIVLGLYKPSGGEVMVFDKDYEQSEQAIKNEIGYVLVDDLFCSGLTLLENANMFGKYYDKYDVKIFKEYCKEFELDMNRPLKKFSKGEHLKFQFAFALAHKPKLLILDEPTANFDPEFRNQFFHIITDFVSDGEHSVILATHLTKDLDRIADYLTFIDKGKMLFSDEKENILNQYRMVSGEDYKINLLPKEKILYKEKGKFFSKAFIKHSRLNRYDKELSVSVPTVEEIMYYMIKGGCHV